MRTRSWIFILTIMAITGVLLFVWLQTRNSSGNAVTIYSDGELVFQIDTANPANWHEYTVSNGDEINVIDIDSSRVRVIVASCPDKLCVKQGELRSAPIVCLPNRLVIKRVNDNEKLYDAITGN